jgi:DMSO/TMAO reductase YedYZ molybdopterin-dependent catalytic subunit
MTTSLPPGQRLIGAFPRFGVHFGKRPPAVPASPTIELTGAVAEPIELPLTALGELPRQALTADFHCVTGWSARGLRWEGIPVRSLYEQVIAPRARPAPGVSHVTFVGLDGYRSVLTIDDALGDRALLADTLDGAPLTGGHGAPLRLVSPDQYGYQSAKHLCRIELHTSEPRGGRHTARLPRLFLALVSGHPRARVWREERHRHLPARLVRVLYRPFARAAARAPRRPGDP